MEILIILFLLAIFVLAPIIGGIALSSIPFEPKPTKSKLAEQKVSNALRRLSLKSYVLFENVILPSQGNTAHTEIDHIVVSPYGIFCIETKSHKGSIYAYEKNQDWAQYLGNRKFTLHSSLRQNYKHIKAIEALLGTNLKAPIHSYVVFPNAYKIVTDSKCVYANINDLVEQISKHVQPIYDIDECTRILKSLAYASSQNEVLSQIHIEEVQAYLATKPA
ncbi:MAG: nuclease-related domain-containing protein [Patescibacteria group bacterium]